MTREANLVLNVVVGADPGLAVLVVPHGGEDGEVGHFLGNVVGSADAALDAGGGGVVAGVLHSVGAGGSKIGKKKKKKKKSPPKKKAQNRVIYTQW